MRDPGRQRDRAFASLAGYFRGGLGQVNIVTDVMLAGVSELVRRGGLGHGRRRGDHRRRLAVRVGPDIRAGVARDRRPLGRLSDSPTELLLLINIFLLFASLFIEMSAALVILVPVVVVVGVDPLQFGVVMVMNLVTGELTPLLGIPVFTSARVGGGGSASVFRAILPFVAVQTGRAGRGDADPAADAVADPVVRALT